MEYAGIGSGYRSITRALVALGMICASSSALKKYIFLEYFLPPYTGAELTVHILQSSMKVDICVEFEINEWLCKSASQRFTYFGKIAQNCTFPTNRTRLG